MFPADSRRSRVAQPIESVGFRSRGPFRVQAAFGFSAYSQPSSPPPPKTTMFSRLSTSKAALKSVGATTRTPSFPSPTVRIQTDPGLQSNPHLSISPGPVPLVQRWSSHSSGPHFPLFLSSPVSELISFSPHSPLVPRWPPPAYLLLVRLPGTPTFTGRFHSLAKFMPTLLVRMVCILPLTHGHTTDCLTPSITQGSILP